LGKERIDLLQVTQIQAWKGFLVPKLHRVAELLATQGIAMAARLFYGFLCVRLLPVSEYAKFTVVFGFLGTLTVLMDISFSVTLLPLIGERIDDLKLIAEYIASLRQLAHRVFLAVAPAAALVYPILVRKQHWNWQVVATMVAILLVASWCSRVSGAYGAVLIVRRDRSVWYRVQMIASLGALALLGVLWGLHWLNAFSAMLLSLAGIVYTALAYYFRARYLLGGTGKPAREKRAAIIHMALPNMPNAIFYAFQGQISLLLITIFGHATAVASVGALSRLAQIFVFMGQVNPLLVEPYFAKLTKEKFKRNYFGVLFVEGVFCLLMTLLAANFPLAFLWILGRNYSGLRVEVLLMIASSAITFLSELLWMAHYSRRYVYWWNGAMSITLILAVQALYIWKADLSTVRAVLLLNLATACVNLLVNVLTGIYGFTFGPRQKTDLVAAAANSDLD
jgi:O-antigen/teichoic acid export membrane protein